MSPTSIADIAVWIDSVNTPQDLYGLKSPPGTLRRRQLIAFCPSRPSIPPIVPCAADDKENPRPVKKRHLMQVDSDQTSRAPKRLRDLDGASQLPHQSPPRSASSASRSEASEVESHQSGRLSPVKQLQVLEDLEEHPVAFCNFDDNEDGREPEDVTAMRRAIQRFADGIGILAFDNMDVFLSVLPPMDRMRFQYPWASDLEHRGVFGSMPSTVQVLHIVETARKFDHGPGASEDEWNSEVQHTLLKLAHNTSRYQHTLSIQNVKMARIEPKSLARSTLPNRVVDYVIALKSDSSTKRIWRRLRPLPGTSIESFTTPSL